MIQFIADENFDNDILRALQRRIPDVDVVRVQDSGLRGADDPSILSWAAARDRVLLTHDIATMTRYAFERVRSGQPMPGVIVVHQMLAIGEIIEDLVLIAECAMPEDLAGRIRFLPLR
jgi:predicted nuclease of predicted toxin-antitoxin system